MKLSKRRFLLIAIVAFVVAVILVMALRPTPVRVDSATVIRGEFRITVEEEGRTRVADRYQVTAPMAGFMSRVQLEPGDPIKAGDLLFTIDASPLDPRTRAQAEAMLARANAALDAARTQVEAEQARAQLAEAEYQRLKTLAQAGNASVTDLDRASTETRRASASVRSAQFAVDVARFEKANAQAALSVSASSQSIAVTSPIDGVLLTRVRQSEGPVLAGEPVVLVGDLASLEVEVDLLSPDAVRLRPGMRVELDRWGGDQTLAARVRRIEPAGFTRYSALGVEEQRVWVIVDLAADRSEWLTLGDGYRVEARFILWEGQDVLQVPASALFREANQWATYVIQNGKAVQKTVVPGRRSGLWLEVKEGLDEGDVVVLHPGEELRDGVSVGSVTPSP